MSAKVDIIKLPGDCGWQAKGKIDGIIFTAHLAEPGWNNKGWDIGRISPAPEDKEEYNETTHDIKLYLDKRHLQEYLGKRTFYVPVSKYFREGDNDMADVKKTATTATKKPEVKKPETKATPAPAVKKVKKEKPESRPAMLARRMKEIKECTVEKLMEDKELLARYENHKAWIKNDFKALSKKKK